MDRAMIQEELNAIQGKRIERYGALISLAEEQQSIL